MSAVASAAGAAIILLADERNRNSTTTTVDNVTVRYGRISDEEIETLAREYAEADRLREVQRLKWERRKPMLWTILVILLVLWLLGLIGGVGGALIHLLLVVALVVFVINLLTGRRTVV